MDKQHILLTQELLSLVCSKWWLNASLMERKQLLNYQLMVLLMTEFYNSWNFAFSWIQCGHSEIYNNYCVYFRKNEVTVENASLKENVQSHLK